MKDLSFKQYKLLSKEHQEEYNFNRMSTKRSVPNIIGGMVGSLWLVFYHVFSFMVLVFLLLKDNMTQKEIDLVLEFILVSGSQILDPLVFLTFLMMMIFFLAILISYAKNNRWLKDHGYLDKFKELELKEQLEEIKKNDN